MDCWVLPRKSSHTPLRVALYRLLLQGFRRFQGTCAAPPPLTVGGLMPHGRLFFNGLPLWRVSGTNVNVVEHPGGYRRWVDPDSGAIKWTHDEDPEAVVWETFALWGVNAA